ncbi:hypothetical protein BBP40_009476 [Aspergillus hancockii]|uniref:Phenylalanine ammonia-lyase hkm12 n=1 Tax=Aspergillus hancockii TaxID=1873369 RepID=HKM12_ASPHA|nr:RecName: Full=Phenylalanine ammonia-lyase hkm12; Short=PAL; AltName: Full=Hancockiamides biosynthesis cluster protein 12 [Aspergillus hancockii]KAF7597138.1 hypothetical protein BBP40_009476 [Aspergillus hancockii]
MLSKYQPSAHIAVTRAHWEDLHQAISSGKVTIDGNSLTLADVVAVSKFGCYARLSENRETIDAINESVSTLQECLDEGHHIYGVNTGFGGSADSRTDHLASLQRALLQLLQSGILTKADIGSGDTPSQSHAMPPEWVKAIMVVRSNSVARGHSAVSIGSIEAILRLLQRDITPVVPLRGTISASGDLMPLAYIVGAIEGNPGVFARAGKSPHGQALPAQQVLEQLGIPRITLGPKEALGLVNGTAASAALSSLVLYEAHRLALLSQVTTALTVEALRGSAESFHPFISQARPHDGQMEAASNILTVMRGSRLAMGTSEVQTGLVQDRYSLRTASQWIGPQLEDLLLADRQITVELNSTTDNPLIDSVSRHFYCGGNFQATSVTSAMEKTRLALQMLGKLMFAQCSEMIDPSLNNGLPTNLVADDPSLSFTMKGVDISMAAYMSELAYLANPVSSHVQTAEMHNQAVNSLAFVSARYTMQAVDIVSMMSACSLYVACQALDLRVLQLNFFRELHPIVCNGTHDAFHTILAPKELERITQQLVTAIQDAWLTTSRMDAGDRCQRVIKLSLPILLNEMRGAIPSDRQQVDLLTSIGNWEEATCYKMLEAYKQTHERFCRTQNTVEYLGAGSKAIYHAIRHKVGVPFHQGFVEQPSADDLDTTAIINGREKKTTGGWISLIYEALRDDSLTGVILEAVQPVRSI